MTRSTRFWHDQLQTATFFLPLVGLVGGITFGLGFSSFILGILAVVLGLISGYAAWQVSWWICDVLAPREELRFFPNKGARLDDAAYDRETEKWILEFTKGGPFLLLGHSHGGRIALLLPWLRR